MTRVSLRKPFLISYEAYCITFDNVARETLLNLSIPSPLPTIRALLAQEAVQ